MVITWLVLTAMGPRRKKTTYLDEPPINSPQCGGREAFKAAVN